MATISPPSPKTNRRSFIELLTLLGIGSGALLRTRDVRAAVTTAQEAADKMPGAEPWPGMTYRTLGRTGFRASRLVYGCGAALAGKPNDRLLNVALEAGVNVFDVGYSGYYRNAERNLAAFAKQHRDQIFLISKAPVNVGRGRNGHRRSGQARGAFVDDAHGQEPDGTRHRACGRLLPDGREQSRRGADGGAVPGV